MAHPRYSPEPLNQQDGIRQIAREEAINAIRSQSITGSMVPRSVPQLSVDIPIVTALPQAPKDGQEVYLRVGDSTNAIAHMLYLASLPGWVQTGMPPVVTTMPTTPFDGMRVDYVADSTNGAVWSFRYRAAGSATYPWEFVGGAPVTVEDADDGTRNNVAYGDLTGSTAGPDVTVPLAGDYRVHIEAQIAPGAAGFGVASYSIGGSGASDDDGIVVSLDGAGGMNIARDRVKTALTAATVLGMDYRSTTNTTFSDRLISIVPVRVGV